MRDSPPPDEATRAEPPWWSIGVAVLVVLVAPLALYSLAPSGPLREGDTIFSAGQQQVVRSAQAPSSTTNQDTTCLLDPGAPLIIVQRPDDRPDGTILALVQGNSAVEWPFCRPQAEIVLKPHQIVQKPDLRETLTKRLAGFIGK